MRVHGDPLSGRCLDVDRSRREVRGTLGCAEFDSAAVAAAAEIADGGDPEVRTFTHDLGEIEVYLEPHDPGPSAIVVSATDVGRALRSHLDRLGYRVTLVEPRRERVAPATVRRSPASTRSPSTSARSWS